ncbi:MAG TPA: hypothetical protein VNL16_10835 [Chloroflexota bacterium]|nr:hypothetical protein [Chloroflexota bacterium]
MAIVPGVPPPANEGRAIWERLCADDPTATLDLAAGYLDSLSDWLIRRNPRLHPHDCVTAAEDAILAVAKNPSTYQPELQTLSAYLRISASGDLKNILHSERRHAVRRVDLEAVELSPKLGKYLWDQEADPATVLERDDEESLALAMARALPKGVQEGLNAVDARVLELMGSGERKTAAYAHVLGLDDRPLEVQRREVKRVKDRLKKRLERARDGDG